MVPRDQSSLTPKKTPKFSRKAHDSHLSSVRPTSFFQVATLQLTPDSLGKTHFSMDGVSVVKCYFCLSSSTDCSNMLRLFNIKCDCLC